MRDCAPFRPSQTRRPAAAIAGDELVYRSPANTIVYEPPRGGAHLADAVRRRDQTAKLFD